MHSIDGCRESFFKRHDVTTGNLTSPQHATNHGVELDRCNKLHELFPRHDGEVYCNTTYDGYLCWPPTLGGQTSMQHCPDVRLSDATQFAFRRCDNEGKWLGRHGNDTNPNGWTNYTPCFPPVVRSLFYKVYDEDESDAQYKFEIADTTRIIEIVGFTLSLITLTISLSILNNYPALNNLRTRIHKNLFTSMSAQVIARLILYLDQAIMRRKAGSASYTGISAIEEIPYLCVAMYVILEYFITVMFMWMLNEGYYLHTLVTSNVLRGSNSYKFFLILGWCAPILITSAWATIAGIHYSKDSTSLGCWYGYNFLSYFWALEGPRLAVIMINFLFLLNIMRVLILKLRQDNSSDVVKARKAVKAAMVLLPLLGITNILSMFEGPVGGPVWAFALWSYTTHFLRSFQGFALAMLYCLCNAEVRAVLSKTCSNRYTMFRYRYPRLIRFLHLTRQPRLLYRARPIPPPGGPGNPPDSGGPSTYGMRSGDMQMRTFRTWHPHTHSHGTESDPHTRIVSETEFGPYVESYRMRRSEIIYDVPADIEIGRASRMREMTAHQTI